MKWISSFLTAIVIFGIVDGSLALPLKLPSFSGHSRPLLPVKNTGRVFSDNQVGQDLEALNPRKRFNSAVPSSATIESPCLVQIHDKVYNVQTFAKAHPGGVAILKKYHNRNATAAFENAGHSEAARNMLEQFLVKDSGFGIDPEITVTATSTSYQKKPLWRVKLFTKEDSVGFHKYLGIFCLGHYLYRYFQILSGSDLTAGFGSIARCSTAAVNNWASLWLIPHALLNVSAFIFHTVPLERVVGQPMIWKEYRVHNAIFVMRQVVCTFLCHLSIAKGHQYRWRQLAVIGSVVSVLSANHGADIATKHLKPSENDSSVATLPFWKGSSLATQRRMKTFYSYCQFMATISCLTVSNPAWPFAIMMPIQFSSILLTLVRKSLLGAKGWHVAYVASLLLPFFVAFQSFWSTKVWDVPIAFLTGTSAFALRRHGVSKYLLWGFAGIVRVVYGDRVLHSNIW